VLRRLLPVVFAGFVGAASAAAQEWNPDVTPQHRDVLAFAADVASFPEADGGSRTELYVSVPLTSLHFVARDGKPPTARIDITAIFYGKKDNQLTGDDWSYHDIPGSPEVFQNYGKSLDRRYVFHLPPGRARVKVRVDEPDLGVGGSLEYEFEVPDFARETLTASDLVFGLCPDMVASTPSGGMVGDVLPHPSRRYGEDTPSICVYARIEDRLGGEGGDTYTIEYHVKDGGGRTVEDSTLSVPRAVGEGEVILHPSFDSLTLGDYRLDMTVAAGGVKVKREGGFSVDESRISFLRDGDKLRTVLGYVATNEELVELDEAPQDSLRGIWERFWARRDPDPKTPDNGALQEFLRRVDYASRNFGIMEPGWRSDRGRIYIKYGAPDNIEKVTNDAYRPPTEIWYYYSRNASYVFQDLEGFGRFRLVSSTRD